MALEPMPVWTELVCRQCAGTGCGQFVLGQRNRKQLRIEALQQGWKFAHRDVFCCRACLNQFEEEKNHEH